MKFKKFIVSQKYKILLPNNYISDLRVIKCEVVLFLAMLKCIIIILTDVKYQCPAMSTRLK